MSTDRAVLSAEEYETLLPFVTAERLGSYSRATAGGTAAASALYEWNMRAAASVMELTSMVEVIARNSLDTQLRNWATRKHGHPSWLDLTLGTFDARRVHSRTSRPSHQAARRRVPEAAAQLR